MKAVPDDRDPIRHLWWCTRPGVIERAGPDSTGRGVIRSTCSMCGAVSESGGTADGGRALPRGLGHDSDGAA